MAKQLEPGHCTKCNHTTAWEVHKTHQICTGCRSRFPCLSASCSHIDCREARGQVSTCGCGMLVDPEIDEACPGCSVPVKEAA